MCLSSYAGQRTPDSPKTEPARPLSMAAEGICATSRPILGTSGTCESAGDKQTLYGLSLTRVR